MNDDKMREEFEAAVIERFKESGFLAVEIRTEMLVRDGDDYYDSSVSAYWHFWKASRAAVVVELPAEFGEDRLVSKAERHTRSTTLSECICAIQAAGAVAKVAP